VKECSATEEAYPYVLFLNNDVILNEGALIEMSAWLKNFARIGIVGARLFYPNGLIQHGGIAHTRDSTLTENQWEHLDAKRTPESAKLSSTVLLTDAVTAACAMMRRSDFHKIGGFDEVLYPVAYSDTDLCSRLRKNLNQLCLMTPYAEGIHHESLSRGKNDIEDYEASGSLTRTLGLELPSVTPRYT
jgi:GT2 family glycosyltransferase